MATIASISIHFWQPVSHGQGQANPMPSSRFEEFQATVILSSVYSVTKVANWLLEGGRTLPSVRLILFSGKQFFMEVRLLWNRAYLSALIEPCPYGSVECGPVGMPPHGPQPDGDDDINPRYKVLVPAVRMELLDQYGVPITAAGRLQPLLRYPAGDTAAWDYYEQEMFRLYGRESVRRRDAQNILVLRVACPRPDNGPEIRNAIEDHLMRVSFTWPLNREAGLIAPVEVKYLCKIQRSRLEPRLRENIDMTDAIADSDTSQDAVSFFKGCSATLLGQPQ
ncbi:hypothetical protein F5Y14DRAFT_456511 [Nemania sp. NC0429]|nr:hypothetical protein F5Y14DRAFT_456511 [Nemania sp. NC0429]